MAVAVYQNILLDGHHVAARVVLRLDHLVYIRAPFIRQEIYQRQIEIAIGAHAHREDAEQARQRHLRAVQLHHPIFAVAVPYDEHHGQNHQILQESLPRSEFQRIAEAAAVLHRDPCGAEEGQRREEDHRYQREYGYKARADLEHQHETHHEFGSAQPDGEYHAVWQQLLESVYRQILVHLERGAPRVDGLDETRKDEYRTHDDATRMRYVFQSARRHAYPIIYRFTMLSIRPKISSGGAMRSPARLQSTTCMSASRSAASR